MFSIWTSLVTHVWATVRPTVQHGHRFHEHTPSIDHAIPWWLCQWSPVRNDATLQWDGLSTVPRCESCSGTCRRVAVTHPKHVLVVNGVQVWAVRRPHRWCDKIKSTARQQIHWFPSMMSWVIVLLKSKELGSRNVTDSWKKVQTEAPISRRRREGMGRGALSPSHTTRGSGERRKLPSGVRKRFWVHFEAKKPPKAPF